MADAPSRPEWTGTNDETAQAIAAWARDRGLAYEVTGLLPPASARLALGFGLRYANAVASGGDGAKGGIISHSAPRPGRFSENVCSGPLPGGLAGALGHHAYVEDQSDSERSRYVALGFTAVVAEVPESLRVARYLVGDQPRDEPRFEVDLEGDAPYGPLTQRVDLTPSLRDRFVWDLLIREDPDTVTRAFRPELAAALAKAPEGTRVTVQGGWVVTELWQYRWDADELDGLCRAASAVADAMRKAAAAMPELEPGAALPAPRETDITRWLGQMVAQVDWPQPPDNVQVAADAYAERARGSGYARTRFRRHWAAMFGGMLVFFVLPLALVGFLAEGVVVGIAVTVATLALAAGIGVVIGRQAHEKVAAYHAHTWGLEAFAHEYARSRGLWMEDEQEFRRRFTSPLHGGPQFSMRGELADGIDGRLVLWRDNSDPQALQRIWNLALVPTAGDQPPEAAPRYTVWRSGPWLVVGETTDDEGRSLASLDALCREAARRARAPTAT